MADIPDILTCWKNGFNPDFTTQRAERLSELKFEIAPMKAHKYDLWASRYRQIEQDEPFYESPQVTMERLLKLEHVMATEVRELEKL